MPGTRCTVAVCNNSYEKTKRAGINILYHKFPKTQPYRDIWTERCKRAGNWNPSSCHVCSIHFTEDDYNADYKSTSKVVNYTNKRKRLKSTAVPSLFLSESPPLNFKSMTQRKKIKKSDTENIAMYLDNDANILIEIRDQTDDGTPIYKISTLENLDNTVTISECENKNLILQNSNLQYIFNGEKENENTIKSNEKSSVNLGYPMYVTRKDFSTQTNPDYFLKNYHLLIDRNKYLENELMKSNDRYKNLMLDMKELQLTIKSLTSSTKHI